MKIRNKTDFIIIHCAATKPSMDIGVKEIDQWHRRRGWLGCGYHYVIRRDGTIEVGRNWNEVGAHVRKFNNTSIGICLIGGMEEDTDEADVNYTPSQMDTLDVLTTTLTRMFPTASVVGHCDLDSHKTCPNFDVSDWWNQITTVVQSG
jgi:N-acetylmuramoyl-L-alanine amidase